MTDMRMKNFDEPAIHCIYEGDILEPRNAGWGSGRAALIPEVPCPRCGAPTFAFQSDHVSGRRATFRGCSRVEAPDCNYLSATIVIPRELLR